MTTTAPVEGSDATDGRWRIAKRVAPDRVIFTKPWPLRPAVTGGFTIDEFSVDEAAGTVTCPNQVTRAMTRTRNVIFRSACGGCSLRARCHTSATGGMLRLHLHDALQRT